MIDATEASFEPTPIDGLVVANLKQVPDERGVVRELFRASTFAAAGLGPAGPWLQLNLTETMQGALRGLHGEEMTKLVTVVAGEALGGYVDLRRASPTFGLVHTVWLRPGVSVLVSSGIANGFQATAPGATQYAYAFDREWRPTMPGLSVSPLDPALGIAWPLEVDPSDRSRISEKDAGLPHLADLA